MTKCSVIVKMPVEISRSEHGLDFWGRDSPFISPLVREDIASRRDHRDCARRGETVVGAGTTFAPYTLHTMLDVHLDLAFSLLFNPVGVGRAALSARERYFR